MAILKCKMCGGDIKTTDNAYGTCESCGSTMTLPKASDERKANLFNRANHFRRQNDFDKAVQAYENILNEDNADAEAHWGVVLSRYGIEYVEDPSTHQMVPTCHRVQSESILKDADYKETLQQAPDEYTKSLYEEEAKKISEIQKGILAISKKEKPYDVFICYKETTDGGSRTKDSTIAQDIYYELTKDGYRVFFAKITLEDKLGQQYEPYIFSALNSAKVMLVIGTSKEHFEAVWVKNEWSRFLAIMKKDRSRLLIPCYRDMDAYDIPDELANLQSQDMSKVGFIQDILRGIKKVLTGGGATETKQTDDDNIVIPKMFTNVTLEKEKEDLLDQISNYEDAKISLEQNIDWANNNVERARDWLNECRQKEREYKIQQQQKQKEKEYLASLNRSDGEFGAFQGLYDRIAVTTGMMYQFNNPWSDTVAKAQADLTKAQNDVSSTKSSFADYNRNIVTIKAKIEKVESLLRKKPVQRAEDHYQRLLGEKKAITDEKELPGLVSKLREMEGYKDTEALAKECEGLVLKVVTYGRLIKAMKLILALKVQYDRFVKTMNKASTEDDYKEIAKKFRSLNGYENTGELASECDKSAVKAKYNRLVQAKNRASTESEYQDLARQFRGMNGYENTAELASECDNQYNLLKEKRKEQERLERERREAQEKREREEKERREAEECERQRIEEEKRKAKERARKKRNAIITAASFFIIAVGIIFLVIRQKNIEKELMREFTTVSAQVLSVHEGTSTETPIDEIPKNTRVEILEKENDSTWVKISYGDGKSGYVNSEHLWRAVGLYEGEMYKGNKNLWGAVKWIRKNVVSDGNYTIVLGKDEKVNSINLSFNNTSVNITLMVAGTDERSVRYDNTQPTSSLITIWPGVTFIMEEGVSLVGQQDNTRRLITVDGGTFIMNGGSIKDNRASSNGGGVTVESGAFTMNNGIINGNASANGAGVYIRDGAFTMNNGTISGNTAYGSGGGVIIYKGRFTMNDGNISENNAAGSESGNGGGGVFIGDGNFIIHNGNISGNSTNRSGGGVFINQGRFTLNNGTISGNKASNRNGGGIHIQSGTFTMNNGTISGNSCNWWGGGVNVPEEGTFTMNNGIISGNKAKYGGGVSASSTDKGIFIKSGRAGIIYGSNASDSLANKAESNNNGHAVVLSDDNSNISRVRNSTAGATQAMDSRQRGAAGGWQ
jgi:uncharacterized protein YgiM (DUF1202 family)